MTLANTAFRLLAAATMAVASACTDPAEPDGHGSLGDYGFLVERDDQFHVVDGEGRAVRSVLPSGVAGLMPDVSSDGSRIVFIHPAPLGGGSHRLEVAVIGIDGTGYQVVSGPAESALRPRWAPDSRVAYAMSSTGEPYTYFDDLVIRSLAPGGGLQHVIAAPRDGVRSLAWSSSGDRLAFGRADGGLWTVDADGTDLQQLTAGSEGRPDWAPDGTRIAYERITSGSRQVCIRVFATSAETCFGISGWASHPRWSPTGEWLAVIGDDGGLHTVAPDGTAPLERVPGWLMQGTEYDWVRLR